MKKRYALVAGIAIIDRSGVFARSGHYLDEGACGKQYQKKPRFCGGAQESAEFEPEQRPA
jgi:hypothetical protein